MFNCMKQNWNLQRGRGRVQTKKTSMEGGWICFVTTQTMMIPQADSAHVCGSGSQTILENVLQYI